VESYEDLFRADYLAFAELSEAVTQWWDLASLHKSYLDFITTWQGFVEPAAPAAAFATWVRALTDWRRLPYLDPGLPDELLPRDWPGGRAADLFHALRRGLAGPALTHVRSALGLPEIG
jgi:phenylacetic acid degradation operon negative regulatory protein